MIFKEESHRHIRPASHLRKKSSSPEGKIKRTSESLGPRRTMFGSSRRHREDRSPMASTSTARQTVTPDLAALKIRQHAAQSSAPILNQECFQ